MNYKISVGLLLFFITLVTAKSETLEDIYKILLVLKECLMKKYPTLCLKQRVLYEVNQTIFSDESVTFGIIRIEKNKDYDWDRLFVNKTNLESSRRSLKLSDVLLENIRQFWKSRTLKLNIDEAFEGRLSKGGKGGGGAGGGGGKKSKGMMMMAAMACMGAGMMMGKMGVMSMAAMMMSKMALLMSALMMLKKMKGGGGGGGGDDSGGSKDKQIKIIYATTSGGGSDYGKGGGGGGGGGGGSYGVGGGGGGYGSSGWRRSLNQDTQTITYRAQIPVDANTNIVYET